MKRAALLRNLFLASCAGLLRDSSALSVHSSRIARDLSANVDAGAQQAERRQALAEDLQFWGEVANATESGLLHLERAAGSPHGQVAGLQLSAEQVPTSAASELGPMSGMLDSMYDDCKKRIVQLKQKESVSKQRYEDRSKSHESRVAAIEAEFRNQQAAPAAMQAEETALKNHEEDEANFFMNYWERVRKRNHKQYHTFLKIQHSMMDSLKSMSDSYQQAEQGATPQAAPEVAAALLQHRNLEQREQALSVATVAFVKDSLSELKSRNEERKSWD